MYRQNFKTGLNHPLSLWGAVGESAVRIFALPCRSRFVAGV